VIRHTHTHTHTPPVLAWGPPIALRAAATAHKHRGQPCQDRRATMHIWQPDIDTAGRFARHHNGRPWSSNRWPRSTRPRTSSNSAVTFPWLGARPTSREWRLDLLILDHSNNVEATLSNATSWKILSFDNVECCFDIVAGVDGALYVTSWLLVWRV